jgi:hypothetical protein
MTEYTEEKKFFNVDTCIRFYPGDHFETVCKKFICRERKKIQFALNLNLNFMKESRFCSIIFLRNE